MANELSTKFIYDDRDNAKVLGTRNLLTETNDSFNRLGKDANFGKKINDEFGLAGKGADDFKRKTEDLGKPTFGGEYFKESQKINDAFGKNKTAVQSFTDTVTASSKSVSGLADAGKNSLAEIEKFARETANGLAPLENIKVNFAIPDKQFDDLSKKATDTRKGLQDIAATRLDSGQVNDFTRDIVRASERSRDLQTRISDIRREINSPNRKTSVSFLTDELKAAEREADSLNRKLNTLPKSSDSLGGSGGAIGGKRRRGLSEGQRTFLELADDFAPPGTNRPLNAVGRAAFESETLGLGALGASSLAVFGSVAALGAVIVTKTKEARLESEARLKNEEKISSAINRQIIGQQEALKNFEKAKSSAVESRDFAKFLDTASINQLKSRQETAEKLYRMSPTSPDAEKYSNIALESAARIAVIQESSLKAQNDSFNQRNEDFKKTQLNIAASEKAGLEQRQHYAESLSSLKDDYRDSLVSLKSADNPLVKQMSDFETATDRARLKFGAFGDSVVNKIADIEKANLNKAIGLQRLDNNLDALKFDQNARRLSDAPERSFAPFQRSLELVGQKVDFAVKINSLNRQIDETDYYANKYNPNNPKSFAEFNRRGPNDDLSAIGLDIKNAISDIRDLSSLSLEGTGVYGKGAIADKILSLIPSKEDLVKSLSSPFANVRGDADFLLRAQSKGLIDKKAFEKQKFSDFVEDQKTSEFGKVFAREQIGLINRSNLSDVDKAQRRLSVTDSLGNDLDSGLRRQAIQDNVLSRNNKLDQDAATQKALKDISGAVAAISKALIEKGIKVDGLNIPAPVVNLTLQGVEATPAPDTSFLPKAAGRGDVERAYGGLSTFDEYEARRILHGGG